MTISSDEELIANLKEAQANPEDDDIGWIDGLADLPAIPTGDQRQAIFIAKRGEAEAEERAKHPKKSKKDRDKD